MRSSKRHRLYHFLKGFLVSPFVLVDSSSEIHFREKLVDLYAQLVEGDTDSQRAQQSLANSLIVVKKRLARVSVLRLCDLTSLLSFPKE